MKGSPPESGKTPTPEEWSRDNLIATIFNSETDSYRTGILNWNQWSAFPLTPARKLDAGIYTISVQMVDDDGYYETACDMHGEANFVWWQKPDDDLNDWKYSIHWYETSGWGSKSSSQRLLGLKVNSGSSCSSVGKQMFSRYRVNRSW